MLPQGIDSFDPQRLQLGEDAIADEAHPLRERGLVVRYCLKREVQLVHHFQQRLGDVPLLDVHQPLAFPREPLLEFLAIIAKGLKCPRKLVHPLARGLQLLAKGLVVSLALSTVSSGAIGRPLSRTLRSLLRTLVHLSRLGRTIFIGAARVPGWIKTPPVVHAHDVLVATLLLRLRWMLPLLNLVMCRNLPTVGNPII